jgi:hypothetical protein
MCPGSRADRDRGVFPIRKPIGMRILVICLVLGLGSGLGRAAESPSALAAPAPNADTIVRCEPIAASGTVGEVVSVDLYVENVLDLYGADVRLSFDPAFLQVVDADPAVSGVQIQLLGDFLTPDFVLRKIADNAAGTIWYAVTQTNPTEPRSGSGSLARVSFQALQAGVITVPFTYEKLVRSDGSRISAVTQSCSITFAPASETPTATPTATQTTTPAPGTPTVTPTATQTTTPPPDTPTATPTATHTATQTTTPTPGTPTATPTQTPVLPTGTPTMTPTPGPATGVILGVVFDDRNQDGQRGPLEPGIPNVLIVVFELTNPEEPTAATLRAWTAFRRNASEGFASEGFASDSLAGAAPDEWATVTAADGSYLVLGLPIGFRYAVVEYDPFNAVSTTPNVVFVQITGKHVVSFGDTLNFVGSRLFLPLIQR